MVVRNLCKFPLILDGEQTSVHTIQSNPCNLAGSFCSFELLTPAWYFCRSFPSFAVLPSTYCPRCSALWFFFTFFPLLLFPFIWKPFRVVALIPFIWLSVWFGLLRASGHRNERRYLRSSPHTSTAIPTGLISSALEFLHLSTSILDQ